MQTMRPEERSVPSLMYELFVGRHCAASRLAVHACGNENYALRSLGVRITWLEDMQHIPRHVTHIPLLTQHGGNLRYQGSFAVMFLFMLYEESLAMMESHPDPPHAVETPAVSPAVAAPADDPLPQSHHTSGAVKQAGLNDAFASFTDAVESEHDTNNTTGGDAYDEKITDTLINEILAQRGSSQSNTAPEV